MPVDTDDAVAKARSAAAAHIPALDGLRGIAALCVLLFHFGGYAKYGYLAVDFFFLLSGFVIGSAYEERLRAGMGFWPYMRLRAERLYPMVVVGTLLGVAGFWSTGRIPAFGQLLFYIGSCLFMVPQIHPFNFMLNQPFWSLFFEIVANAAHALCLRWLSNGRIVALVVLSLVVLLCVAGSGKTINGGYGGDDTWIAIPRVVAGFGLGLLLHRTRSAWQPRLPTVNSAVPLVLLLLILGLPHGRSVHTVALVDTLLIGLAMPLIVMLGVVARGFERLCLELGVISYPLYATHFPVIEISTELLGAQAYTHIGKFAVYGAALACAWLLARLIDLPVGKWFRVRRKRRGFRASLEG